MRRSLYPSLFLLAIKIYKIKDKYRPYFDTISLCFVKNIKDETHEINTFNISFLIFAKSIMTIANDIYIYILKTILKLFTIEDRPVVGVT